VKTLLSVLAVLIPILVYSQSKVEIDSLTRELHNGKVVSRWKSSDIAARLGWMYNYNRQYDSSLRYYKYAIELAPTNSRDSWLGNIHLGIGSNFSALNQWDSAFYHSLEALKHFKNINDIENISLVNSHIAIHFYNLDLYEAALAYTFDELPILEHTGPSFNLASRYDLIGLIYQSIGEYVRADQYHRKALEIRLKINQPLEVAKSYNNLGELFLLTHQYDNAKHNLILSANLKHQLNDTQGLARTLTRLGKALMLTGETDNAQSQLLESLATQRQINDSIGMIETLNNLGELYLTINQVTESNKTLLEANTIIHASGTPDYLRQNLELRVALARKQKDFVTGMDLQDELLIIRDSLLNEEKSKSLQAMQIRYETKKKEQEISLLEQREEINQAKIDSNRILIGSLITGLTLVAAIGLLIYFNFKNTKAAKQRIELLLSETRHRMKNHLQTLASIFHLQTRHYTNHEMVLEAKSSESRVHTMSLLHDKFFTDEIDQVINARDYITDLVHKLVDIYGSQTKNLKLSLDIEDVELDIDKAFALSLIIQELICNAFKYAFAHELNPELLVDIHQRNDHVHTMIHDNGIGFSGNTFGTSQGLNLVDALVSQLDGEMHTDNNRGTTFMIRFPATSLWKKPALS
jgi:two-component sensor histidine kinase